MIRTQIFTRTAFIFVVMMTMLANESDANIRADWEIVYDIDSPFYIIESDGDNLYAAGREGIHVSRTGGNTWRYHDLGGGVHRIHAPLRPKGVTVQIIASGGGAVYVGTIRDGIFRSDDCGKTWHPINEGLPYIPAMYQLLVTDSGAVIVVGYHLGTWISHDRGESWTAVTKQWTVPREAGVPDFTLGEGIWSMIEFDGYLWAVYGGSGLYRSRDEGGSWEIVYGNIDNFDRVTDWAVLDDTLYVAGGINFGRWNEAEHYWEVLNRGRPVKVRFHGGIADLAVNRGRIFASLLAYDRGVWLFDQSSETWAPVGPQNAEDLLIYSIASRGSYLYAASTLGIHRGSIPDVQSYGKVLTTWGAIKGGSKP